MCGDLVTDAYSYPLSDGRSLAQATFDGDWHARWLDGRGQPDNIPTYYAVSTKMCDLVQLTDYSYAQLHTLEKCRESRNPVLAYREGPYFERPTREMPNLRESVHMVLELVFGAGSSPAGQVS